MQSDKEAFQRLKALAKTHELDIRGGEVRVHTCCDGSHPRPPQTRLRFSRRCSGAAHGPLVRQRTANTTDTPPDRAPKHTSPFHLPPALLAKSIPPARFPSRSTASMDSAVSQQTTRYTRAPPLSPQRMRPSSLSSRGDTLAGVPHLLQGVFVAAPCLYAHTQKGHTPLSARVGTETTDCRRRLHAHKQTMPTASGETRRALSLGVFVWVAFFVLGETPLLSALW